MLPLEAKIDRNGLLYIDDERIKEHPIIFQNIVKSDGETKIPKLFFELFSTSDYIVKYSRGPLIKGKIIDMLLLFQKLETIIQKIDFPIGYYQELNRIRGIIIRYYKNAPSLYSLSETHDINILGKYYYHDDDTIHNLYLLMYDTLLLIEELFENNVYYTDVHRGNFILSNNEVKLIDFDYSFIHYKEQRDNKLMRMVLQNYDDMLFMMMKRFGLGEIPYYRVNSFENMKKRVKRIEDQVRKRRYY